jgi:transposase InsO family protein
VLRVSRSGFYAWLVRPISRRAAEDERLRTKIKAVHAQSRRTYGSPRVCAELRAGGEPVSRKRVARLMRRDGLQGRRPKRFRVTTDSNHELRVAPNVIARNFEADGPNQKWLGDITYLWTSQGWLYLAVILDAFSRKVVGWAIAEHLRTDLALAALRMAITRRLGKATSFRLVHHSDRGVQYASEIYQRALEQLGIDKSMSRRGNCWDNAVAESFFATLKVELLYRKSWPTKQEAREEIADYIERFYNPQRLHSTLGYLSPEDFEANREDAASAA